MLRSVVLLIVGLVITFSATFHEQFGFDVAVVAVALGLIGAAQAVEAAQRRSGGSALIALAHGVVSIAAAVLVVALGSQLAFAIVIAAWALMSALLEFVGMAVYPGSRQDAALVGGVGIALALTVLLARGDLVAIIGFFGAYAVITGVFLGIAAFDTRRASEPQELAATAAANA
ncbi:hypothetical protein ACFSWE_08845 [Leucobacter albus]|uniref:DUF308 domain-containing protein n=1 Tax=Leucobacter albus TaxID=272210 RepID=A0ABW3TSN8_9MICO